MDIEVIKESSDIILKAYSTKERLLELENRVISDISSRVSLPGFRRGKIANEIIKKKFKIDIKEQVLKDFADEVYLKYSQDNEHNLIENPQLVEGDIEDNKISIKILLLTFPEVIISKYKGLKIKRREVVATKEDIEEAIKYIVNKNSKTKTLELDTTAKNGDIVTIDYKGFIDGEEFEGGSQKNYDLRLGSNTFLEGFEQQIEGHKRGDEFEVKVKFSEDYFERAFSNKEAIFKVSLKDIKAIIIPSIDDELAKMENFENIDMLKKDLENKILIMKQKDEDEKFFREIINELKSKISIEIPEKLVEKELKNRVEKLNRETNISNEHDKRELNTKLRSEIENELKDMAIIRTIIKRESIEVTAQEVENYLREIFGEKLDEKTHAQFASQIESGLKLNKVKKFLIENNS